MLLTLQDLEKYIKNYMFTKIGIMAKIDKELRLIDLPYMEYSLSKKTDDKPNYFSIKAPKYNLPKEILPELYSSDMHVLFLKLKEEKELVITGIFEDFKNELYHCTLSFYIWDVYEKSYIHTSESY